MHKLLEKTKYIKRMVIICLGRHARTIIYRWLCIALHTRRRM